MFYVQNAITFFLPFFQKICDLVQVLFIILFTSYLCECVDYNVLFTNKVPGAKSGEKVHLGDVFKAPGTCIAQFPFMVSIVFKFESKCF